MRERNSSLRAIIIVVSLVLPATAFTACGARADKFQGEGPVPILHAKTPILLFTGTGTSPDDVKAIETLLASNHLDFSTVSSFELNGMDEKDLRGYLLLIIPGGNFVDIGNSLTSSTTANVRDAVHNGLNYLGVCAGAFLSWEFSCPLQELESDFGCEIRFLRRRESRYSQGSGGDYRCRRTDARTVLGRRSAIGGLGCGGWEIPGWNSRHHRRNIRQRLGDLDWCSRGGSRKLAARDDF